MARTPALIACTITLLLVAAVLPAGRVSAAAAAMDGGLLFAGLDSAAVFERLNPDSDLLQRELVGIIVDGNELGTEMVYRIGGVYYLPSAILARIGVRGAARNGRFYLQTPGGEVETGAHYFREVYGQMFFRADMLDEVLKVRWEFAAEKYAISMTLPWWQSGLPGATDDTEPGPDVEFDPSTFGITQVRLDHTRYFYKDGDYGYSNLLVRGRLAEGVWRSELIHENNRDLRAENYYWLKDFEHVQALVGNQDVLINPAAAVRSDHGRAGAVQLQPHRIRSLPGSDPQPVRPQLRDSCQGHRGQRSAGRHCGAPGQRTADRAGARQSGRHLPLR